MRHMRDVGSAALVGPVNTEPRRPKPRWLPVSALEFVGCDSCRMTLYEYDNLDDDWKVEFFDSEAGLAWTLREPPTAEHEEPARTLGQLVARIAMVRGSPIKCLGETQLRLLDPDSRQVRSMHPDELLFLDRDRREGLRSGYLQVGEQHHPDVVLEVDHTTDVRGGKLKLYEEWGFPELWVEVPDAYSASRPRGLRPGLKIYLLEGGRYEESVESRAFPGWQAAQIHRALNEEVISAETSAVLARVGRALGEREGTGPDDDIFLGPIGREKHAEGRAAGIAEGRAAGIAEGRAGIVRAALRGRGVAVSPGFPANLSPRDRATFRGASPEAVLEAASTATSEADFLSRLE